MISRITPILAGLCLVAACANTPPISPAARAELAPTGTLRVGINYGNVVLATRDPASDELRGVHVDRDGTRVAIAAKSAYEFYLGRNLKHAKLVAGPSTFGAYDVFVAGKLDALVGIRPRLVIESEKLPGSRVLEGRFMAIEQTLASPKGRDAAAGYISAFIEDVKASGFVARLINEHGVRGVSVSPAAPAR